MTYEELRDWYTKSYKRPLTREEIVDWAYGNVVMSNPEITREMVEKAYDLRHNDSL